MSVQVHTSRKVLWGNRARLLSGRNVRSQQMYEEKSKNRKTTWLCHFFLLPVSSLCSSSVMATIHRLHYLCLISTGTKQDKWWKCRKFSLKRHCQTTKPWHHSVALSTNTVFVIFCPCRSNQNKHIRLTLNSQHVLVFSHQQQTVRFLFCLLF